MQTKRLVISINSCWNFVNFRAGLLRALIAEGYEIVAFAPADEYCSELERLGCRFVPVPMNSRGTSPMEDARLLLAYRRLLRRERPLAFLAYTIKPNIYGSIAAHRLGIPVINNVAGLGTAFLTSNLLNRMVRLLYAVALRRSRTIFFQNGEDRQRFLDAGLARPQQARLLPGSGVDMERFSPRAKPASDGFVFLLTARMLRTKGLPELIEAARRIRSERPDVRFQVAGIMDEKHPDGIALAELEGWVAEGAVDYLGRLDDVRPALAGADCVVLPTNYPEGTPRGLLEAAAMGKPIIATDVPGCRDVVADGVNGFLGRPRDVDSLVAALRRVLALPPPELQAMGAAGRALAEQKFDERIVIREYLDAVKSAIGSAKP